MEEIIDLVMLEIDRSGYRNRLAGGLVVTGGGSLMKNTKQLFEYKTGMDTRIGYPNEHLGKCDVDAVKNPMYSTAIGLVLAGFRSLDDREENRPEEIVNFANRGKGKGKAATAAAKSTSNGDFINTILRKTKELLIDDFDDKNSY